jgi:hypothetical protein
LLAITEASVVAITLGVLTFLGVLVGAVFSYLGQREARAANRAVNNVGPGKAPITDRVDAIEQKVDRMIVEKVEDRRLLNQILDHLTDNR